ncbi:metal ABC transporter permease [Thioclava sp. SK-1]|uniref:ABCB family ABC transporter ATP-binding protein/permease n=1 Tax=Thioclava sp. SK-1 TaxID=1889770 RepID=UPI0008260D53|nr:ABC transporter ATP-binding protein/permease [Thioclava sp. SK-1]OCX66485.1 metal ABC transporter permease [Thioclava sp. SK-1]
MPPSHITTAGEVSAQERARGIRTIKQVAPYLWPDGAGWVKRRVVIAMAALLLGKVIAVATPFFYKQAVDTLAGDSTPSVMWLPAGAVVLTLIYGFARIGSIGFNQLRDAIFARVGQRALRQLAGETFNHIHRLSMRYHITRRTGGLSRVIERGVKGVEFLLRFLLFSIGPLILELSFVALIFLFAFDWRYALVVVVTIAAYVKFTFAVTEWRVKIRRDMNTADTEANQKAIDSLLNFETVKYFGAEKWEADRYDQSMRGYEEMAVKTGKSLAFLNFGQALIIGVGLMAVMIMAAIEVQAGTLSVGDFVMVQAYMIQITMPLNFLGSVYREIRQALTDMADMFDLLHQPAEVTDAKDAPKLQVPQGEIVLDNVSFHYDSARPILTDFSLTIPAGSTVALVGASGSGKSTIGRLLFRFYDVTSGAIRIDGQDLRDITQNSLHRAIGVVPQDTVLFNDTIRYNIAYGRPGATEAEVIEAAIAARIHDFIQSLPEGYDTAVGERGLKLSGGEKQRVGIARTILKNPPILLLDEATSALDTQTERDIQTSLRDMGQGRTVISIAHRLSTISDADIIVVMDKGKIVEQGRHEALLARNGRYCQMWARQSAEGEEEKNGADSPAP